MKILTLLARHGVKKYAGALDDIRALYQRHMPDVQHTVVIADNTLPLEYHETLDVDITLIGASNEAWEFSAWDSAVAHVGDAMFEYDFVHLATSAFHQLYVAYLNRIDSKMLGLVRGRAAAVGHIDYYNEPVTLLGQTCQSWLRTSYVFLPPSEVALLGAFVSVTDGALFFSGNPESPFWSDAPISEGYRRNIIGWLTGDGTNQGTEWHSRFVLNEKTLAFFESKVLAILNEQMLSNRLRSLGCVPTDATWLATQVSGEAAVNRPIRLPDWRVQVTSRDNDRAPAAILN